MATRMRSRANQSHNLGNDGLKGRAISLDSVQYQPLTTCNTGENSTVPYVDSCNEISHHNMISIINSMAASAIRD